MNICDKCKTPLKKGKYSKYCPKCNHSHVSPRKTLNAPMSKEFGRKHGRKGGPAWNSKGKKKNRKG